MSRGLRQGRSTGSPTLEEQRWFDAITTCGCIFCIHLGYDHDPDGYRVEQHHHLSGGIRMGHLFSVGACIWHHRGRILIPQWSLAVHWSKLGPNLEHRVPFEEFFGDQDWQMQKQLDVLAAAGVRYG